MVTFAVMTTFTDSGVPASDQTNSSRETHLTESDQSDSLTNPLARAAATEQEYDVGRRFQKLLEHSRDYFVLTGAQGNVLYANAEVDPILGYTSEEYLQISPMTLLHPEDVEAAGRFFQSVLSMPGETRTGEFRRRHKQGHYVWVEINVSNLLNDPDVMAIVINHHDISERKKAEEALLDTMQDLHHSQAEYSQLIETQTDFICRFQPDLTVKFSNRAHNKLLGKKPEEVVGKRLTDLIPPESGKELVSLLPSLTLEHPGATWEQHITQPDGTQRWIQWRGVAIPDDNGHIFEYQGVGRDITERKQAELAEREQRRISEVLRDSLAALTASLDVDAVLRQLLDHAAEIVPCDAGSIILFEEDGGRVAYLRGYGAEAEAFFKDYRLPVGAAKFGKVQARREPYLIPDTALYPEWIPLPITTWIRSSIGVPIEVRGKVFGLIAADSVVPNHFKQKDVDNLRLFAHYASLALENAYHVTGLEQKVAERTAELNLAKERVEAILENSLDGIILTTFDLQIQQSNAAFDRLVGCDSGDCFEKSLLELVVAEEVEQVSAALHTAIRERSGTHLETRIRHQNGIIVEVELGVGYIDAGEALPNGLVCSVRDIGPRKDRERQLRYHASLQDNIHDAVIATDLDGRIQSWNQAAERIYGWSASEAIGKSAYEILRPPPGLEAARDQAIADFQKNGSWHGEVIQLHRNDTRLHFLGSMSVLEDENGVRIGVVSVNHDMTERKKTEQALAAKMQEDQEFQKYLTALHEVSIELTAIDELDLFYRRTVELGLERLGFERLALFLNENGQAVGTYGTDAQGHLTDEHSIRFEPSPDGIMIFVMEKGKRFHSIENTPLYEKERFLGNGWKAAAALRNETETLGWLITDNGVHFQPASKPQPDILALYSLTVGTLLAQKRIQVALHDSEALYRMLADNISDIVTRKDKEGCYLYVSPSTRTILGYEPEELLGQLSFSYYHPDDLPQLRQSYAEILVGRRADREIYRFRHKDGHYVWLETTRHAIVSEENDEVTGTITSSRDVTERKRAEEAIRESEARYRLLADNIRDLVIRVDTNGELTYVSPSCQIVLGSTPEELAGQSAYPFIHPDDFAELMEQMTQAQMKGALASAVRYRFRHKAGHYIWLEATTQLIRDDITDEPRGFIVSNRDISERKRAEEALRESEARYRLLANNISDVIIRIDPIGTILYASPSSAAVLGFLPEELVNSDSSEFVHPDDISELKNRYLTMVASGEVLYPLAYRFRHKQGHYAWMETTGQVLRSETTGEITGFILSNREVTERKKAEEAIRESETRYRLLADHISDVVIQIDRTGTILYASPSTSPVLGYFPEELLSLAGNRYIGYVHPDDQERLRKNYTEIVDGGFIPAAFVYRFRHKQGHYVWVETSSQVLHSETKGEIAGFILSSRDVTQRKMAEEALRNSEELLRKMVEIMPVGVWLVDPTGKITLGNSVAKQIWAGLEYVGREDYSVYKAWWSDSGIQLEPQEWGAARAIATGEISLDEELEIECFDGTHKYILNSAIPLRDSEQTIVGAIVVNQDITERKRMENARRESEALFRSLVEAAPDYILRLDYQGVIQMANPTALRDSGFLQEEMIGHPFSDFLTPESKTQFAQELHHLLEEGTSRFELEFMSKAGLTAVMECSGSVTYGEDDQPPSIVLVHRDVTQRKKGEELLRQALEHEKELNELKSRFVSMASHEFRTPLAAILASSEILLAYRKRMNEDQINGKLNTIEDQVKHLANIVEDVLDLSRMQTGRVEFKPVELEMNSFIIEIISEFQTRPDISHTLVYEPNPVSVLLKLDRRLMRQVLSNLISNAIKYSAPGSRVTIALEYSETSALLSVSDLGIGIPENDMKYLFQPFHRGSNVADISGTGLGLSIVKQAMEMHGGHVWADSKVGLGTTIYLSIPLPTPRNSTE